MKRVFGHPLLLSILTIGVLYVVFAHLLYPPLPRSLVIQYMVICIAGVLLVASFEDRTAKRLVAPVIALMGSPKLALARAVALICIVAGAGALTYSFVKPSITSPLELRTVHPAPPSTLRVYGENYNLLTLENPVRAKNPKGTEGYDEAVAEGAELYYANCLYCHGDRLDGQGHFGEAFSPRPANFQDVGTIAQLQESYLFWRITTGGPGLPREGTPWASAMPVWHEMLEEDEVWKIITFLYDYTGHVPRSWELEEKTAGDGAEPEQESAGADTTELDEEAIDAIYMKRCAQCHGEDGDGEAPAAEFMYPKPRDFTLALFKYKTTHADDEFPTDDDFRKTIRDGLTGTAMPAWKGLLNDAEIDALIYKIKQFGEWEEEEIEYNPIDLGTMPEATPEVLAQGREQFVKVCAKCHGDEGRGNVTSGKRLKDDWENRVWPRNLTRPETWRYTKTATDIFQRLSTGIRGTPMPEHTTTMSVEDRWAIAHYAMTLRENSVPPSAGETVIKAVRVEGALPDDPADPAWDKTPAMTFAMAPNIIKEPRLFYSLNDMITVRALFNGSDIALRLDVDDRTFSVPGDPLEVAYGLDDVEPTRDAVSVQLPMELTATGKPWFRHGDPKNAVNMWYWAAPSVEPEDGERVIQMDAAGPGKPPVLREDSSALSAKGVWKNGRWQVVFKRALETEAATDLRIVEGRYIPIAFANWDGLAGEVGGRHSFTSWYWLLLEPVENKAVLYGAPPAAGLLAGLLFLIAARRQRKRLGQ
jgi:DMSO reductase family type II enzyme heme b subunit